MSFPGQAPARRRSRFARPRGQRGQALIYGIFVLVAGLAVLFFMFNTGQFTREKTKLVNSADAVIYTAGVMHARALNFHAYTNRAMIANTVAIAQLVSLSSWTQYVYNVSQYGVILNHPKYEIYYPAYELASSSGPSMQKYLNDSGLLKQAAEHSDEIIRTLLMRAQGLVHTGIEVARTEVMNQVLKANYLNDGEVTMDPLWMAAQNSYDGFVKLYKDDERDRFAEVAKTAANLDRFVPHRSWLVPGLWADCVGATPRVDWLDRRGGTNLIGFDEWKAADTLSAKNWTPSNKTDVFCRAVAETPAGWALQSASNDPSQVVQPLDHDVTLLVNPSSTGAAVVMSSDAWGYSGLPNVHELTDDARADPNLRFSVRLMRNTEETLTSEGRSSIRTTPRLNNYHAAPAGGVGLVAVSTSEVYFSRESANAFGGGSGKPAELPSLFNPFWQVRLVHSSSDIMRARALQGVVTVPIH